MEDEIINARDKDQKRATFGICYPPPGAIKHFNNYKEYETYEDYKDDYNTFYRIENFKIKFNYKLANIKRCTFFQCQFFLKEESLNVFNRLTFKNCTFDKCFLGSVDYNYTRFESCSFINCDFSNSRFEFCVFDNCVFSKCSAYHPEFISTEISPNFLKSIVLLKENYNGNVTNEIRNKFCYMKLAIAKKVYNSNNSIDSHELSDLSFLEVKKAELEHLKRTFPIEFKWKQIPNLIFDAIDICLKWSNIKLTDGGTSLKKLLIYTFLFILIVNIYFSNCNIIDCIYELPRSSNFASNYFTWIPRSTSIVLGYGYTSFQPISYLSHIILNGSVIVGLFSYALLISVLMRKIYK